MKDRMQSQARVANPILAVVALVIIVMGIGGCSKTTGTTPEPVGSPTLSPTNPPILPTSTPMPTALPTKPACLQLPGKVEQVKIQSSLLKTELPVSIYTPPCFNENPSEPYPVLYLLHGQNMSDTLWAELGALAIVDQAIRAGQKPFLIVMPYEERNFDPPGDSLFGKALISDLIPWVDNQYPTCTLRECRAIGGISRGGGWAVHMALRNFELFGAIGAHSMGLMAGDTWLVQELTTKYPMDQFPRIYVDRGESDYMAENIDLFEKSLTYVDIPHAYVVKPGSHDLSYWQAQVKDYMDWYMAGWK
jgi:enterochelin esterase-like enzyme